jgi:hypothetical protein
VKLSARQREVLERLAGGGVLMVRLEPGEAGVLLQRCWIGTVELLPMTVNALIAAGLLDRIRALKTAGGLTATYVMGSAGQAALDAS